MRKLEFQDTFRLAKIIKKSNLKEDIATAYRKGREAGASANDIGSDVFFALIDAAGSEGIEDEVYDLIGSLMEKNVEDIKHQSMKDTLQMFREIAKNNEMEDFFESVRALMK